MVEGDHDGGGDLAVEPVGGQVFEELDERLALPTCPVLIIRRSSSERSERVDTRVRLRRGEASCWRVLRKMAPARVGTVKWPDTVPSWLSCRVSRVLARAATSSPRSRASSWASTTATSCSTTARARRAALRSRTGSSRLALATRAASTRPRSSGDRDSGNREAAAAITQAWAGESAPSPRAAAVAGRSSSRAVARRTSRAASAPPARVCLASQAPVPGRPASRATSALSAAASSLASAPGAGSPRGRSRRPGRLTRPRRAGSWCPGCRAGRGSRAPRRQPGGRCRGGDPILLSCLDSSRTHVRIPWRSQSLWRSLASRATLCR